MADVTMDTADLIGQLKSDLVHEISRLAIEAGVGLRQVQLRAASEMSGPMSAPQIAMVVCLGRSRE